MVISLPIAVLLTILIAVVVALPVLSSLLIVVTPRRKGEEREELEATIAKGEYEPHARSTATRTTETERSDIDTGHGIQPRISPLLAIAGGVNKGTATGATQ